MKTFSIKEKEAGEMTEGGEILVGFESRAIAEKVRRHFMSVLYSEDH